jgi:hypothetical protein
MNKYFKGSLFFGLCFAFIAFGTIWFQQPASRQHPFELIAAVLIGSIAGALSVYWVLKLADRFKSKSAGEA